VKQGVEKMERRGMRLFFATDLHGSDVCFRKFCAAVNFYGADHLILGGDLTGKLLIPIETHKSKASYSLGGRVEKVRVKALEPELVRLSNMGYYPVVGEAGIAEELADGKRYEQRLQEEAGKRVRAWISYAHERLGETATRILVTGGNDDEPGIDEAFENDGVFIRGEGHVARLGGIEVVSCGWSNPTPWNTPRECSEHELAERLASAVREVQDPARAIFNFHVPPYDTALDICPELDETLQVQTVMGSPVQQHAGSTAVRQALEESQPCLSVHGHIHESRGVEQIGLTTAVNPGSEYSEGVLLGAVIDIDDRAASAVLTAG
jgi:Icc-related predicted phosphoesterase